MKYYKFIKNEYNNKIFTYNSSLNIGIIYPENYQHEDFPISFFAVDTDCVGTKTAHYFQEVSEKEYWQQELNNGKLIEGGYYVVIEYGNIFKYKTSSIAEYYLGNSCTKFCRNGGIFYSDDVVKAYRLATEEEIEWLEACNRADEFVSKEGMYKEDFVLPEKWCIKGGNHLVSINFKNWHGNPSGLAGNAIMYYHFDGNKIIDYNYRIQHGYKEITFEQFKKYVLNMKEENQLPKYWFIKNDYPEVREYLTKKYGQNFNAWKNYSYIGCDGAIKNNGLHAGPKHCFYNDAVEITIEEFRKYTNNLNEEKVNKNIIGYKLIKSEYKQAVNKICGVADENIEGAVNKLKEAGVLDLWFEPVYEKEYKVGDYCYILNKENSCLQEGKVYRINEIDDINALQKHHFDLDGTDKKRNDCWLTVKSFRKATPEEIEEAKKLQFPDITINGYKAEFFDDHVKFGCAKMNKEVFINLATINEYTNTNREVESVTIGAGTFSKDVIKQIVEYYKNREE